MKKFVLVISLVFAMGYAFAAEFLEGDQEPAHDVQLSFDPIKFYKKAYEEDLKRKVDQLLEEVLGKDHFYSDIYLKIASERGEKPFEALIEEAFLAILIDKSLLEPHSENVKRSLAALLNDRFASLPYAFNIDIETIDLLYKSSIAKESIHPERREEHQDLSYIFWVIGGVLLSALVMIIFFIKKPRRSLKEIKRDKIANREDPLFKTMTAIDLNELANSFKNEDPETIALMLSYLEKEKAEQMLAAFDPDLQEEVLRHL